LKIASYYSNIQISVSLVDQPVIYIDENFNYCCKFGM